MLYMSTWISEAKDGYYKLSYFQNICGDIAKKEWSMDILKACGKKLILILMTKNLARRQSPS